MIDLHCHSLFSDGTLTPEELIVKAEAYKIKYLSLTDHDTMAGYPRLQKAAQNSKVRIINGIELSVRWKKYDIHILGYQLNETQNLINLIQRQNDSRIKRAEQIGARLDAIGLNNTYLKACEVAGHDRVGRPHFAKVLVNESKARDLAAAFKQFLIRGRIGYVPTLWVDLAEAIDTIVHAGGMAVIAHPQKYGLTRTKLHELINEFKEAGGVGIEVVSGDTTVTQIKEMAATCLRFNLLASSGSDFHSETASRVKLGQQAKLPINCTPIWYNWTKEQGTL